MIKLCLNKRKSNAHTIIELGMVAFLFSVIAMFCADIGFVMLASQLNDRACRDAARAAAQGSDYGAAVALAMAALAQHKGDGNFVADPALEIGEFQYEDFGGSPPPNTSPYVRVTTTCSVRVPAPIFLGEVTFGTGESGIFNFSKTYEFPIVRTTLYLNN